MYVLTQTHGDEKEFVFDYNDHNILDIRDDVRTTLEALLSGNIDGFTVRWVKDE